MSETSSETELDRGLGAGWPLSSPASGQDVEDEEGNDDDGCCNRDNSDGGGSDNHASILLLLDVARNLRVRKDLRPYSFLSRPKQRSRLRVPGRGRPSVSSHA